MSTVAVTPSDILSNLSNLLPTGTFLAFQALAPLFTNNGMCGEPERVMTGILLFIFTVLCFMLSFVDSVTTESGKIYYGIVTKKGLFNPQFKHSTIDGDLLLGDDYFTGGDNNNHYQIQRSDFINGVLSVMAFGALACLTPPVSTCYYPEIPVAVVKCAPILAAIVAGVFFGFAPPGRKGVGFSLSHSGYGFVPDQGKPSSNATYQSASIKPPSSPDASVPADAEKRKKPDALPAQPSSKQFSTFDTLVPAHDTKKWEKAEAELTRKPSLVVTDEGKEKKQSGPESTTKSNSEAVHLDIVDK